ncbi:uncharacterized protein BO87DRAFT_107713 [Aspergillus neoniger CBS 115656]|uniref:Uncharacterized protein n=1 Tax=Aspergillus neoniger (strain CBS 115656) TaxID=1448310 RepID=A0A318YIF4_ASPNB|nr:hypothetical protein BO87DRAFT_107713 [Aspergillus neoniger CBS 115656]PYH32353.1 hypothetical protein BO87DRAFT_107713 [Aspergillus neoniger CBS 115656]
MRQKDRDPRRWPFKLLAERQPRRQGGVRASSRSSPLVFSYTHTHTHTHRQTDRQIHTGTHTHTHSRSHTYIHIPVTCRLFRSVGGSSRAKTP